MIVVHYQQERLVPSIIPLTSFGFSTRILTAKLQDHDSAHVWDDCARVSTYIDHSKNNAENDSITFNFQTGHICPQFSIVFDDNFETVDSLRKGEEPAIWKSLATHKCEHRLNDKKKQCVELRHRHNRSSKVSFRSKSLKKAILMKMMKRHQLKCTIKSLRKDQKK